MALNKFVCVPKIVSRFSLFATLSAWFLLNGAKQNVFSPQRSVGFFIEFCPHAVLVCLSYGLEANLFAYSRHGINDAGRSPRQNDFSITIVIQFMNNGKKRDNLLFSNYLISKTKQP